MICWPHGVTGQVILWPSHSIQLMPERQLDPPEQVIEEPFAQARPAVQLAEAWGTLWRRTTKTIRATSTHALFIPLSFWFYPSDFGTAGESLKKNTVKQFYRCIMLVTAVFNSLNRD